MMYEKIMMLYAKICKRSKRFWNAKNKGLSILLCVFIILPLFVIAVNAETTQVYSDPFLIFSRPYAYYYMRDEAEILDGTLNPEGMANQFYLQQYAPNDIRSYTEFLDPSVYYNYDLELGTKRVYQSSDNGIDEQYSDFPIRYVQKGDVISFSANLDFTRSNALLTFQPTAVYDTYTIRRADGTEYFINNYATINWRRIYLGSYDSLPYPEELCGTVKVEHVRFNYNIVIPEGGQLVDWGLHFSREENRLTREDSANNYDPNEIGNQYPPCNYLNYYFRSLDWTYTTTDDNALLNGIVNNNQLVINKVQSVGDSINQTVQAEVDKIINFEPNLVTPPPEVDSKPADDVYDAEDQIINSNSTQDSLNYLDFIFSPIIDNDFRGIQVMSMFINDLIINNSFFVSLFRVLIPLGLAGMILGAVGVAFSRKISMERNQVRIDEKSYYIKQRYGRELEKQKKYKNRKWRR